MREKLPNRRSSAIFAFEHNQIHFTVGYSRYRDGRLAEVFVDGEKVDSAADIAMRDCAIILSFALQHGCPVSDILPALTRGSDERPLGPMGKLLEILSQHEARS